MDSNQACVIRSADSMKVFADGDETFCFGQWRAWRAACAAENRAIAPAEFKAQARIDTLPNILTENPQRVP